MVSAVVPPNVGSTLPTVISQTSCASKFPVRPDTLAQTQPSPANLIYVEIRVSLNNLGQVVCDRHSSTDGFPETAIKPCCIPSSRSPTDTPSASYQTLMRAPMTFPYSMTKTPNGKLDLRFRFLQFHEFSHNGRREKTVETRGTRLGKYGWLCQTCKSILPVENTSR
jgi:hypothetical protein